MHLARGGQRVGADRKRIAHRQQQRELLAPQVGHVDDVGDEQRRFLCARVAFELLAHLLDHGGRVIDERRHKAALEQFQPPFASPAAQVAAGRAALARQVRLDHAPSQLIVKMPVRIIINRIVLTRNAVVVTAGAIT